jgi:hypothetical protein
MVLGYALAILPPWPEVASFLLPNFLRSASLLKPESPQAFPLIFRWFLAGFGGDAFLGRGDRFRQTVRGGRSLRNTRTPSRIPLFGCVELFVQDFQARHFRLCLLDEIWVLQQLVRDTFISKRPNLTVWYLGVGV